LNYHEGELEEYHTSLFYNLMNPLTSIQSRLNMYYFKRYALEVQDLGVDVQRFGAVREVHEKLKTLLGDKRTFFDNLI
jgi:hypothetical protein